MSWCSGVSLSSRSWAFCGFCPWFSSSLLDSYCEESWSSSCARSGAGSGGGTPFFAGAADLRLDKHLDGTAGTLAKRPCLSLESEMVPICGEQVSPGVSPSPFKQQGEIPVVRGQGRQIVISPLPKIKGCT